MPTITENDSTTEYVPRHDWDTVRRSTNQSHLEARMRLLGVMFTAALTKTPPDYIGLHRVATTEARYFVQASRRSGEYIRSEGGYLTYQESTRLARVWTDDPDLIGVQVRYVGQLPSIGATFR